MPAKISSLRAVMDFVRMGAREANMAGARINELDLLVEEAVVNVCRHAYTVSAAGDITVSWSIPTPGTLSVEIADQGIAFNPLSAGSPDLTSDLEHRPIGGLGIHLLKTLAPSLSYRRENGWNRLMIRIAAAF